MPTISLITFQGKAVRRHLGNREKTFQKKTDTLRTRLSEYLINQDFPFAVGTTPHLLHQRTTVKTTIEKVDDNVMA